MTADEKFKDKVCDLIDSITDFTSGWKFNSEQIEMIRILNNDCDRSELYEATRDQAKVYRAGLSAEQIFMDMIFKITDSPTTIHMLASIRLLIPEIWDKIQEELKDEEWFEGTELCGECCEEFDFIFYPAKGLNVVCPNCGTIQHPCSLCRNCDGRCEENLHSFWKNEDKSIKEE